MPARFKGNTLKRRTWIPAALVIGAIVVLIGCIPIPSTQQFQPNGQFRPEYLIGTGSSKPIQLGKTSLVDALIVLKDHVGPRAREMSFLSASLPDRSNTPWGRFVGWKLSTDHRRVFVPFYVRQGFVLMPLCFAVAPIQQRRVLELEIDEHKIVTASKTHDQNFIVPQVDPESWLQFLDQTEIERLREADVFSSQAELDAFEARRNAFVHRATTRPH